MYISIFICIYTSFMYISMLIYIYMRIYIHTHICMHMILQAAVEADWSTEYCDKILAVKIVGGVDEAIAHINK
jgi:gamma-glutamyl phosphate reductase